MTIEEKAKAYDDAIKEIRELISLLKKNDIITDNGIIESNLQRIFPQLNESEDERIKKELVEYHKQQFEKNRDQEVGLFHKDAIAYLEKQKESLRDFIDNFPYSAEQKEPHYTKRNALFDKCVENCDPEIMKRVSDEVDEMLEKEQDWNKKPCLTCQEYEKGHKQGYTEGYTAGYNKAIKERNEEILGLDGNPICYEQKPAEINLKVLLTADCLASAEMTGRLKERNEILENPEKYGLQKPVEIDEYKIIKKHITEDSLSSEVNKRLKECGWYVTDEKTAEWSDEDSRMLSDIAGYISGVGSSSGITKRERVDFLYELPKRFNLQPKQNWSEEDKKKINFLSRLIEFQVKDDEYCSSDGRFISKQEAIEMLKSLRPQPKSEWSEDIIRKAVKEIGLTQHQIDWFKDNVFPSKVEWSEEDEGELQNAIDALEFLGKKGVYKSESGYDAALQAASWLKNLSLDLKKRNEDVTKLCSNEWSEEDKNKLYQVIETLLGDKEAARHETPQHYDVLCKAYDELIDFLKSLPERFHPQPKKEWSEEDRLHYANVLEALEYVKGCKSDYDKIKAVKSDIAWLKLLRNRVGKEFLQPHWKPTNEQMKALKDAKMRMSLTGYGLCPILQSLITDLQKLL